ncbi:MAG: decarboxylating 6-phosphogluconate dehydrogenase [bacterium]
MEFGFLGLGRMGANMVKRLIRGGIHPVIWNRTHQKAVEIAKYGTVAVEEPLAVLEKLPERKIIWLMLPAGDVTDEMIDFLMPHLKAGDILVDGANTNYVSDILRYKKLRAHGIHYIDVGVSGGVWGLDRGYCLMIGGDPEPVEALEPVFKVLAPGQGSVPVLMNPSSQESTAPKGFLHCGPAGSGHFVKMVHNGIEYGIMQSYSEGINLLKSAIGPDNPNGNSFDFDLQEILELWRRGSVIGSWLLDLTLSAVAQDPSLESFDGFVQDSGEGRWMLETATKMGVPVPALAGALFSRFSSREKDKFSNKILSAMRFQFGGHKE